MTQLIRILNTSAGTSPRTSQVIKEMEKVKEELTELKEDKKLKDEDTRQKNELKELRDADIVQKEEIEKLKASNERIQLNLMTQLIRICSGTSPRTTPENTPSRKRERSSEGGQPQTIEF